MISIAMQLGITPMPTAKKPATARVVSSSKFTGTVVRERIAAIAAVLADDLGHDTHVIARRIGATTKHTQQALTQMCKEGTARKVGMTSHGLARVVIWRKA